MSNHLAIATVTAALGQLVHAAAQGSGVGGVALKFGRPTAPSSATERKVHVYLYQVAPNAALRNADTPTRDAGGRVTRRPQAALDLFYLVSFFGDPDALEPDRMLGAAVRDLHARPLLNGQAIADAIASRPALSASDLAASVERVKFTPIGMTLDEMSRLWSVMTQTPHALSVAYQSPPSRRTLTVPFSRGAAASDQSPPSTSVDGNGSAFPDRRATAVNGMPVNEPCVAMRPS